MMRTSPLWHVCASGSLLVLASLTAGQAGVAEGTTQMPILAKSARRMVDVLYSYLNLHSVLLNPAALLLPVGASALPPSLTLNSYL